MAHYKNIIFDLGGVILNIDYELTFKAFKNLGLKNFDTLFSKARQKELFDNFETGKYSADDFRNEIKKFHVSLTSHQIDHAWNSMLLDLPRERLSLLSSLKNKYRLFLLSNTNTIHIDAYSDYLKNSYGFSDLSHIFEKQYYSFALGMRKPDAHTFDFVLKENNLKASETLFIDDSPQHIEGAKKLGIQTYYLQKTETILNLFSVISE